MKYNRSSVFIIIGVIAVIIGFAVVYFITSSQAKSFDISSHGDVKINQPIGVASNGVEIFIANSANNEILVYDKTGKFEKRIGKFGNSDGQFNYPVDVAVDPSGNIYVADFHNNRIQVFSKEGNYLSSVIKEGMKPATIEVSSNGNIFVSDLTTQQILLFDKAGHLVYSFGSQGNGDGQFNYVNGLALTSDEQHLVVSDSQNKRLQMFTRMGDFEKVIPLDGAGLPKGISIYDEHVYVADALTHKIFKVSIETGETETVFKDESFKFPNDIMIEGSQAIISDRGNSRVQVLPLKGGNK